MHIFINSFTQNCFLRTLISQQQIMFSWVATFMYLRIMECLKIKKNKNNNGEQYNQSQPCISLLHVKPQTSENKNNGIQKHFWLLPFSRNLNTSSRFRNSIISIKCRMAKCELHCDNWHVSIMFFVWNLSFLYWLLKVIVGSLNRTRDDNPSGTPGLFPIL